MDDDETNDFLAVMLSVSELNEFLLNVPAANSSHMMISASNEPIRSDAVDPVILSSSQLINEQDADATNLLNNGFLIDSMYHGISTNLCGEKLECDEYNDAAGPMVLSKPKGYVTAFNFFIRDNRKLIPQKYGSITNKEMNTILGQQWKSLSKEEKGYYEKLSVKDKIRYCREVDQYNLFEQGKLIPRIDDPQKGRDQQQFVRPLQAYNIFAQQEKQFLFSLKNDVARKSGVHFGHRWRRMAPDEKEMYQLLEATQQAQAGTGSGRKVNGRCSGRDDQSNQGMI